VSSDAEYADVVESLLFCAGNGVVKRTAIIIRTKDGHVFKILISDALLILEPIQAVFFGVIILF
jgi:hypothetical protein